MCEYGVLPIENSTAGSVGAVYELMLKHNFYIVRSCRLKVSHSLLAKLRTCGMAKEQNRNIACVGNNFGAIIYDKFTALCRSICFCTLGN